MLCGNTRSEAVGSAKGDVARLDTAGHVMRLGCRVDDLIDSLHGEIEGHKLTLRVEGQQGRPPAGMSGDLTTGCKPARAAPTVNPQKPDSVIGLSMTLFSPNRSSRPLVTL